MKRLAERLSSNPLERYLFFGLATLLAVLISGYHFGTFDQVFHIPYLKKYADPSLYPGDPFLELRHVHYSYFWFAFQPFLKLGILEEVMFVVHLAVTYFTVWAFWDLTDTLFKNPVANLLVTTAVIFPHMALPGFQIIEFSLLNRTFVLPFLIWGISLYLKKRYLFVFLLMGLMYNLHVLSVSFVMAMLLLDCLLRWRTIGWQKIATGLILFFIGALPVLLWRGDNAPVDLGLRPVMLSITSRGLLYSVYYMFSLYPQVIFNTLAGMATLLFILIPQRKYPSTHDHIIRNFIYAIGIVLVVQLITTYLLPITIIIQMQILRIGVFLMYLGYPYFAYLLAKEYEKWPGSRLDFTIIALPFVTFISPLMPLAFYWLRRFFMGIRWRQVALLAFWAVMQVGLFVVARSVNIWAPGITIGAPKTPWVDAQNWARENTSKDARFITPPQIFWHYIPDWRVFSERGTVATLPELMEIPFAPDYLISWQPRFESVAPGAIADFKGDYFENIRLTAHAYYSLSRDDLLRIARYYKVRYIVVEKPHAQDFPVAYENEGFIIYDIGALVDGSPRAVK